VLKQWFGLFDQEKKINEKWETNQEQHLGADTLQLCDTGFKLVLMTTKQALKTASLKFRF